MWRMKWGRYAREDGITSIILRGSLSKAYGPPRSKDGYFTRGSVRFHNNSKQHAVSPQKHGQQL